MQQLIGQRPITVKHMSAQHDAPCRMTRLGEHRHPIVIGLVNNMSDGALQATEEQYRELLSAASSGRMPISLKLFSLPELHRSEAGRSHIRQCYEDIGGLWSCELDGLIVTGTEPRAAALTDEPYWPGLTTLIDWAGDHTISTIWSCLAAHAAVLHTDGIRRRRLKEKLVGVFDCCKIDDHFLLSGMPSRWRIPHSRHNEVSEKALISHGYNILSKSPAARVDIFVKKKQSLFVFFQGHPEYDRGALAREYQRDVRRFLSGRATDYPSIPRDYFDEATMQKLTMGRTQQRQGSGASLSEAFPAFPGLKPQNAWWTIAVRLYRNWLLFLTLQKSRRLSAISPVTAATDRINSMVFRT